MRPSTGVELAIDAEGATVTRWPPAGLILGARVFDTLCCAIILSAVAYLILEASELRLRVLTFAWNMLGAALVVNILAVVLWTVAVAVGWYRYYRFGIVPIRIHAARDHITYSRPGIFRAVVFRRWSAEELMSIDVKPLRGVLIGKPPIELVIRVKGAVAGASSLRQSFCRSSESFRPRGETNARATRALIETRHEWLSRMGAWPILC